MFRLLRCAGFYVLTDATVAVFASAVIDVQNVALLTRTQEGAAPRALYSARAMERRLSRRTALLATDAIYAHCGAPPLGQGGAGGEQRLADGLGHRQLRRGIGVPRARKYARLYQTSGASLGR